MYIKDLGKVYKVIHNAYLSIADPLVAGVGVSSPSKVHLNDKHVQYSHTHSVGVIII